MLCIKLMYKRFDWLVSVSASIRFESGWGNLFSVVACSWFYKVCNKGYKFRLAKTISKMKSIYCRYSKEPSHLDGAFEYSQHIICIDLKMIKEIYSLLLLLLLWFCCLNLTANGVIKMLPIPLLFGYICLMYFF